jgi:hypothetical protein
MMAMKRFKKKHTKLPSKSAVRRLLRREGGDFLVAYDTLYQDCPAVLPEQIRAVTLAEFDPCKRQNIRYYPDLHNFKLNAYQNRSLPIPKFLALFRPYMDGALLDQVEHDLTNYRLEFYTNPDKWIEVYEHESVDSCMTGTDIVRCYAHPQNKLAIAALYAPGGNTLIGRSIVNTDEKWYVRLFGDTTLLVEKLREQGYDRIYGAPKAFRMYGYAGRVYNRNEVQYPYFDFSLQDVEILHNTHNPETGLIEVIINPGLTP